MPNRPGYYATPPDNTDFFLEVIKSNVEGHIHNDKFGAADDIGTSWTVVASAKTYAVPTSATALEIVSSDNTNDIAAGTGARKVVVVGLDENWNEQSETVSLNGTTAVALANTYLRVYRMYVSESGTYATASAPSHNSTITLRVASGGATWANINTESNFGFGQSLIGCYTVPAGYKAFINSYNITTETAKSTSVAFFKRENADDASAPYSGVMRLQSLHRGLDGAFNVQHELGPYPAKTDIGFFAKSSSTTSDVSVQFEILLISTDFLP